ncbi:DUF4326 domain-containing protein [Streptomyces sp. 796.1]|uniref:DUF4326 domain-containing protein n=1 Tax=Streptomyces sp. 796.1 TaxID=3163029 RepID=UPI0039C8D10F
MPTRIQRRRTKGWRVPAGAVYVGPPSRWGNPYPAYDGSVGERVAAADLFANLLATRNGHPHPEHLMPYPADDEIRRALAGRDLVCWCPLPAPGQPDHCHAAVLLRLANAPQGAG